ncbi:hypothetical protein ACUN90_34550, partial [Escherichia sp. SP-MK2]
MNLYQRRGFQRTFLHDVYHVEEQLKAYDPHLYLMWNPKNGEHVIMDGLLEMSIMKKPPFEHRKEEPTLLSFFYFV